MSEVIELKPKRWNFRPLMAKDIAPVCDIFVKLDYEKIVKSVIEIRKSFKEKNGDIDIDLVSEAGLEIGMIVLGAVLEGFPKVDNKVFAFMASVSNLTAEQVGELPLKDFKDFILEMFAQEGFADFLADVGKSIK